jgi:hypothetical protein
VGDEAYAAYSGVTRLNRARAQARDPHTEYSVTTYYMSKSTLNTQYLIGLNNVSWSGCLQDVGCL